MKVSIIGPDKKVVVDGTPAHFANLPPAYDNVWAIHYDTETGHGHVEWTHKHKNDKFTGRDADFETTYITPAINMHAAKMAADAPPPPTLADEREAKEEALERELARRLREVSPEIKTAAQAWLLPLVFDSLTPANRIKYQAARNLVAFYQDELLPYVATASKAELDEVFPGVDRPVKTKAPWPTG